MYTKELYLKQGCYQIIVTNNVYIMYGLVLVLNWMHCILLVFNESEYVLDHLYTQLKALIILFWKSF
jgi:hypothetical protein